MNSEFKCPAIGDQRETKRQGHIPASVFCALRPHRRGSPTPQNFRFAVPKKSAPSKAQLDFLTAARNGICFIRPRREPPPLTSSRRGTPLAAQIPFPPNPLTPPSEVSEGARLKTRGTRRRMKRSGKTGQVLKYASIVFSKHHDRRRLDQNGDQNDHKHGLPGNTTVCAKKNRLTCRLFLRTVGSYEFRLRGTL